MNRPILDDEEVSIHVNGQDVILSWHPPSAPPPGKNHGSAGVCFTERGEIVVIRTEDWHNWDFPGGRPEGDETLEQTLRREVLEEACVSVGEARLLGFSRGVCAAGPEKGLALVRSFWRAEVTLHPWEPQFEIKERRVVPPCEVLPLLAPVYTPIYLRALSEAGAL